MGTSRARKEDDMIFGLNPVYVLEAVLIVVGLPAALYFLFGKKR